jgi:hypothetical protein
MSRELVPIVNVTRRVVSIERDDDGCFEVVLECGHRDTWVLNPPTATVHCAQCLDALIERLKQEPGFRHLDREG